VKIADFGITKRIDGTSLMTSVGTVGYMAPEPMGFLPVGTQSTIVRQPYTSAVDIWSLGQITFELLVNHLAFPDLGALSNYVNGHMGFPREDLEAVSASRDCMDFVEKIVDRLAERRLSAEQALRQPWMVAASSRMRNSEGMGGKGKGRGRKGRAQTPLDTGTL
jgi:serine/threonine protein kinase